MTISLIVAMDEQRGIGKAGKLPWRLSSDLKRFRELTMGHHIIVGRKTFESIGKPLPGRQTIVVTRSETYRPEGCLIAHSVEDAIRMAQGRGETEVFICGGAAIYAAALAMADRLYLTRVHSTVDADVFFTEIPEPLLTLLQAMGEANEAFPDIDETDWVEKERWRHEADEKNQYPFTFSLLEKKR